MNGDAGCRFEVCCRPTEWRASLAPVLPDSLTAPLVQWTVLVGVPNSPGCIFFEDALRIFQLTAADPVCRPYELGSV